MVREKPLPYLTKGLLILVLGSGVGYFLRQSIKLFDFDADGAGVIIALILVVLGIVATWATYPDKMPDIKERDFRIERLLRRREARKEKGR